MQLPANRLDSTILWPSYYLTAKPKEGIALTEIVSFLDLLNDEKDGTEWILSDKERNISVVTNLSAEYKNANLCKEQLNW